MIIDISFWRINLLSLFPIHLPSPPFPSLPLPSAPLRSPPFLSFFLPFFFPFFLISFSLLPSPLVVYGCNVKEGKVWVLSSRFGFEIQALTLISCVILSQLPAPRFIFTFMM